MPHRLHLPARPSTVFLFAGLRAAIDRGRLFSPTEHPSTTIRGESATFRRNQPVLRRKIMTEAPTDIGLTRPAAMGRNPVLNMNDRGYKVSVPKRTLSKRDRTIAHAE